MPAGGVTLFNGMPIGLFLDAQLDVFKIQASKIPDYTAQFFQEQSTDLYRENFLSRPGIGLFNTWDGEGTTGIEMLQAGYETTIQQAFWRKQVAYTYKFKKFARYADVMSDLTHSLAIAAMATKNSISMAWVVAQIAGTNGVYWNATAAKYLFSTTHTLANGDTYVNKVAVPFTPTTLGDAITSLMNTPDEQGNAMDYATGGIDVWIAASKLLYAREVIGDGIQYKSDQANFTKNVLNDYSINLKPVASSVWPAGYWVVKPSDLKKTKLISRVSEAVNSVQYYRNEDRATIHDASFAFQIGAADFRGIYASTGS